MELENSIAKTKILQTFGRGDGDGGRFDLGTITLCFIGGERRFITGDGGVRGRLSGDRGRRTSGGERGDRLRCIGDWRLISCRRIGDVGGLFRLRDRLRLLLLRL